MPYSSAEPAVSKLYILYILQETGIPMTNAQITHTLLENDLIDYFSLQQYLHDLEEAGYIGAIDNRFMISKKGAVTLDCFKSKLPPSSVEKIKTYTANHRQRIEREREIFTSVTEDEPGDYKVHLQVLDDDGQPYIEIRLRVPTAKTGRLICENWKNRSSEIYSGLIEQLISSEKKEKTSPKI